MIPKSLLLVMDVSALSPAARTALFCLIGLLLVTLGIVVLFAMLVRRQTLAEVPAEVPGGAGAEARPEPPASSTATSLPRAGMDDLVMSAAGELAVVSRRELAGDAKACPTCRREFEGALQYCLHDARKLIPAPEMLYRSQSGGNVCIACRRAFDSGVRFCPHDGNDLVSLSVYEAARGEEEPAELTGTIAKICPACGCRHDYAARFCGKDGTELASIN